MKLVLPLLLFLSLSNIVFADTLTFSNFDTKILTLQDCINIAVSQNQTLKAASADIKISQAIVTQTNSSLQPHISLIYNWTRQLEPISPPIISPFGTFQSQPLLFNEYRDGLSLNQLIFDGAKTISLVRQAKANTEATKASYLSQLRSISYDTLKAYYTLLSNQHLLQVAEETFQNTQDHLKLVEASYKAGTSARADVVFASVPVASAKLNLTKAREAVDLSLASLNRVLGFNVTTPLFIDDHSKEVPYSKTLEQAFTDAEQHREEIVRSIALVESAKEQLNAARGSYMPVVSTFANYGYTDYGANTLPANLGWSFGVQGTFPIFQGNLQAGEVAEAKATLDKNLVLLDSVKQDIFLDVKQSYIAYQSAEESVAEAQVELSKALENLHMAEGQYKVGVVPILNLLDAQVSYTQAETHYVTLLFDCQIAIGKLHFATGI